MVAEDLTSEIQTVAEGVGTNTAKLEIIQTDIELIKKDLTTCVMAVLTGSQRAGSTR